MNLHGLATGIGSVNPLILVSVQTATGMAPGPGATRVPVFAPAISAYAQVQELSTKDLQHMQGLNLSGTMRKIYANGALNSVLRSSGTGGDLVALPDATVWKVTHVLEQWPDWCSVVITLQSPGS
jgi:hypothetical protein